MNLPMSWSSAPTATSYPFTPVTAVSRQQTDFPETERRVFTHVHILPGPQQRLKRSDISLALQVTCHPAQRHLPLLPRAPTAHVQPFQLPPDYIS